MFVFVYLCIGGMVVCLGCFNLKMREGSIMSFRYTLQFGETPFFPGKRRQWRRRNSLRCQCVFFSRVLMSSGCG